MPIIALRRYNPPYINEASMEKADKIAKVEEIISYTFNDKDIIWEALQVSGSLVTQSGERFFDAGNQRIAIIGDRIAELILAGEWYKTRHVKGRYGDAKAVMTSDNHFATIGRDLGLYECLNMNPRNRVPDSKEIMSAVVEAIFGAVYLDSNESVEEVRKVMRRMDITYAKGLDMTFFPVY